ncbi:FAD protein [Venustampulla echinocandica]|uniref:FAD protein n=1 Tax=Venustampulla echinocandica TaxID=2656787 RepID=A0A370TB23_9HELO|nr:FAD protein [Venustampulla echinocandica]RDL31122.1 FAD protein [Venustampulla echinocandica]
MGSTTTDPPAAEYDVIIIGAGISGINAAYRLQTELPDYSYTILESRTAIGGTWDLFRYPGIRSDSDLHTFGFPWRPWPNPKAIADGASILEYMNGCAEEFGIDRKIQYEKKLLAAEWSSKEASWTLSVERLSKSECEEKDQNLETFKARFVVFATGYYNYSTPLETNIPNLSDFKGPIVQPQFWPSDLDHANKKIIIIGSGATAITLLPSLAETALKVTMLQRSPSYILTVPAEDPSGSLLRKLFPSWISHRILRWKFLVLPFLFITFCKNFPNAAKKLMRRQTRAQLPSNIPLDPHFNPSYYPWEQRLCICPDGDFYTALRNGKADIVTDTISSVTATGIRTTSGQELEADIIVTATGLKVQLGGGAKVTVDSNPVVFPEKFLWKSTMIEGVPNAAVSIGYTNASWTLGSDTAAFLICRVLKYMRANGFESATPSLSNDRPSSSAVKYKTGGDWKGMRSTPLLNLSSTYLEKAKGDLPKAGNRGPWLPRSNYFFDRWVGVWGDLTSGLSFVGIEKKEV